MGLASIGQANRAAPAEWSKTQALAGVLAVSAVLFCCTSAAEGCQSYLGNWVQGLPRCNMSEQAYVQGTWRKAGDECRVDSLEQLGEYAYPYEPYCNPKHHVCNTETDTCSRKVLDIASWQWQPSECNLHHWSAEELDKKLAGRKVMFVGDSIQVQQFFSFRHLMRREIAGPWPAEWGYFFTHRGTQFQLQAAQFLVGKPCCNHFEGQSLEVLPDAEWLRYSHDADVLVLNHGHHFHRRDVTFRSYDAMVRNVMATLRDRFRGYVIFRTSNWGHHRCSTLKQPLRTAQEALDFGSLDHDPYHWMAPIHREYRWGEVAQEMGMGHRFRYANASITMLRGDGHLDRQQDAGTNHTFDDCMHECMPGAVDYWNWLVFNVLVSLDF